MAYCGSVWHPWRMAKIEQSVRERPIDAPETGDVPEGGYAPSGYNNSADLERAFQQVRERIDALSRNQQSIARVLSSFVETWNREAIPVLMAIREETARMGGSRIVVTEDYDVLRSDRSLLVDATDGSVTLSMVPAADVDDYPFTVTKTDSTANAVTLDFYDAETCGGTGTQVLSAQYATITVQSDGVNYWIVSQYTP